MRNSRISSIVAEEINSFLKQENIIQESGWRTLGKIAQAVGNVVAPNLTRNVSGLADIAGSFNRMRGQNGRRYLEIMQAYEKKVDEINHDNKLLPSQKRKALETLRSAYGESYDDAVKYLYPNGKPYGNNNNYYGGNAYSNNYRGNDAELRQSLLAWNNGNDIQKFLVDHQSYFNSHPQMVQSVKYFFQWCQKNNKPVNVESYNQWYRSWA